MRTVMSALRETINIIYIYYAKYAMINEVW